MHRCYVPDPGPSVVSLPEDQAHHVGRVLRLGVGADVVVFDGRGHEWTARIVSADRSEVRVALTGARTPAPEPPVAVTLAIALLKGDQMSAVVRDATALGAAVIAPFVSGHVAVPERAWSERSNARWTRVAIASAMQCARAVVPQIQDVVRFGDLIKAPDYDARLICVEPARQQGAGSAPLSKPSRALVCVGPEGGWSPEELSAAQNAGALFISLGPRTLRAELAPAVALSALWSQWGWS